MSTTLKDVLIGLGFDFDDSGAVKASAKIKSLESQVNGLTRATMRLAKFTAASLGAEGVFLMEAGNFEKTTVAFETMTQSVEKGRQLLADLAEFSLRTSFGLSDVEKNSAMLIGMGIETENVIDTMKMLGDVAAGINRPLSMVALNYGQIRTRGVLMGTELRDFARIGVPIIEDLAQHFGVAEKQIAEMVSSRLITFKHVEDSFRRMTSNGGRFANLMIKQAQTLPVMVSNAGIALRLFARDVGKYLLPDAKEAVKTFNQWMKVNKEFLVSRTVKFFKGFHSVLKGIAKFAAFVVLNIEKLAYVFGGLENVLKNIFLLLSSIIGLKLLGLLGTAVIKAGSLSLALIGVVSSAMAMNLAIGAIPALIGAAVVAAGLLAEELDALTDSSKEGFIEKKIRGTSFVQAVGKAQAFGEEDFQRTGFRSSLLTNLLKVTARDYFSSMRSYPMLTNQSSSNQSNNNIEININGTQIDGTGISPDMANRAGNAVLDTLGLHFDTAFRNIPQEAL